MNVRTICGTQPMTEAEKCAAFDRAWAQLMRWAEKTTHRDAELTVSDQPANVSSDRS